MPKDLGFAGNSDYIALEDDPPEQKSSGKRKRFAPSDRASKRKRKQSEQSIQPKLLESSKTVRSRTYPWTTSVPWDDCKDALSMLHHEIAAFASYIRPTEIEHRLRAKVVRSVSKVVRSLHSDATVHPFGSYITKLYLPAGDIDLVIATDKVSKAQVPAALRRLSTALQSQDVGKDCTVIAKAKVPIVKFTSVYGDFAVDISYNQTNTLRASNVIVNALQSTGYDSCCALIFIIKSLLAQRGLNEVFSGGLSSYAIICLVISYFQLHPKIQSGEWDPSRNLGIALLEMLELYGVFFNYQNCGISIRHGGSYFSKLQRGWYQGSRPYLISIEDPNDPINDISAGSGNARRIQQAFAGAHEVLVTAVTYRDHILRGNKSNPDGPIIQSLYTQTMPPSLDSSDPNKSAVIPPDSNSTRSSILGCIVTLYKEDIRMRNARLTQLAHDVGANLPESNASPYPITNFSLDDGNNLEVLDDDVDDGHVQENGKEEEGDGDLQLNTNKHSTPNQTNKANVEECFQDIVDDKTKQYVQTDFSHLSKSQRRRAKKQQEKTLKAQQQNPEASAEQTRAEAEVSPLVPANEGNTVASSSQSAVYSMPEDAFTAIIDQKISEKVADATQAKEDAIAKATSNAAKKTLKIQKELAKQLEREKVELMDRLRRVDMLEKKFRKSLEELNTDNESEDDGNTLRPSNGPVESKQKGGEAFIDLPDSSNDEIEESSDSSNSDDESDVLKSAQKDSRYFAKQSNLFNRAQNEDLAPHASISLGKTGSENASTANIKLSSEEMSKAIKSRQSRQSYWAGKSGLGVEES